MQGSGATAGARRGRARPAGTCRPAAALHDKARPAGQRTGMLRMWGDTGWTRGFERPPDSGRAAHGAAGRAAAAPGAPARGRGGRGATRAAAAPARRRGPPPAWRPPAPRGAPRPPAAARAASGARVVNPQGPTACRPQAPGAADAPALAGARSATSAAQDLVEQQQRQARQAAAGPPPHLPVTPFGQRCTGSCVHGQPCTCPRCACTRGPRLLQPALARQRAGVAVPRAANGRTAREALRAAARAVRRRQRVCQRLRGRRPAGVREPGWQRRLLRQLPPQALPPDAPPLAQVLKPLPGSARLWQRTVPSELHPGTHAELALGARQVNGREAGRLGCQV